MHSFRSRAFKVLSPVTLSQALPVANITTDWVSIAQVLLQVEGLYLTDDHPSCWQILNHAGLQNIDTEGTHTHVLHMHSHSSHTCTYKHKGACMYRPRHTYTCMETYTLYYTLPAVVLLECDLRHFSIKN